MAEETSADKIIRDALMEALQAPATSEDGTTTNRLAMIAGALVEKAAKGDVPSVKEIFARVEGKGGVIAPGLAERLVKARERALNRSV